MGSTSESRPAAADQFPVPAQDGGRGEQQATDGKYAAESCEKQAVGREQVWALDMAAQDGELMPEGPATRGRARPPLERGAGVWPPTGGPEHKRARGARAGKLASDSSPAFKPEVVARRLLDTAKRSARRSQRDLTQLTEFSRRTIAKQY